VDSFKNVSNKKLSDTQLDSLGTVVQGIGGLIVEHKKAHAVKKIVLDTQGDVDVVCDLLIADFGSTGLGLGQGLNVTIKRLKGDADIALAQTNNFQDRLIAIEGYRLAETNKAKLDTVVKKARQLLIDLKKANSQLAGALQDDKQSISDIRAMGAKFKELRDALRLFTTM
jgi:phosphoglycolate phosphatase-like HAD superfamily hydrolase